MGAVNHGFISSFCWLHRVFYSVLRLTFFAAISAALLLPFQSSFAASPQPLQSSTTKPSSNFSCPSGSYLRGHFCYHPAKTQAMQDFMRSHR